MLMGQRVDSHVLLVMVTIEFWMRKPSLLGPSPLEFDGFAIRASPALEMGDLVGRSYLDCR